jgi:hypothetical protein
MDCNYITFGVVIFINSDKMFLPFDNNGRSFYYYHDLSDAALVRIGNSAAARPVTAYGVIYLILDTLILLARLSWTPMVAVILTVIGGIGATTQLNNNPDMRDRTLFLLRLTW